LRPGSPHHCGAPRHHSGRCSNHQLGRVPLTCADSDDCGRGSSSAPEVTILGRSSGKWPMTTAASFDRDCLYRSKTSACSLAAARRPSNAMHRRATPPRRSPHFPAPRTIRRPSRRPVWTGDVFFPAGQGALVWMSALSVSPWLCRASTTIYRVRFVTVTGAAAAGPLYRRDVSAADGECFTRGCPITRSRNHFTSVGTYIAPNFRATRSRDHQMTRSSDHAILYITTCRGHQMILLRSDTVTMRWNHPVTESANNAEIQ
jgi:hypothetical protein